MKKFIVILLGAVLLGGLYANSQAQMDGKDEEAFQTVTATAMITGTEEGSQVSGTVTLIQTEPGLAVDVSLINVPAGSHGFHIHENGSCEDGGKAAGGHYNPMGVRHGYLPNDGIEMAHIGDMGNVVIGEDGTGTLTTVLPGVSLRDGEYNVEGLAIILHAAEDDFGQPTGNAGGRIGCGIILIP